MDSPNDALSDAQALDLAIVPPGEPAKQPPSAARLAGLKKAQEAAARKRREHGPTPAQREAQERMQAGAARKRAAAKLVKEGGAVPDVDDVDGIVLEPAPYPERPGAGVELIPDEVLDASDSLGTEPATAVSPQPVTQPKETNSWLRRATGIGLRRP